jgi:hypothetical protein
MGNRKASTPWHEEDEPTLQGAGGGSWDQEDDHATTEIIEIYRDRPYVESPEGGFFDLVGASVMNCGFTPDWHVLELVFNETKVRHVDKTTGEVTAKKLPDRSIRVAGKLLKRVWVVPEKSEPWIVWPSHGLLAWECNYEVQTVYRAIVDLVKAGLIERCKVRPDPGHPQIIREGYSLKPLLRAMQEKATVYRAEYKEACGEIRVANKQKAESQRRWAAVTRKWRNTRQRHG